MSKQPASHTDAVRLSSYEPRGASDPKHVEKTWQKMKALLKTLDDQHREREKVQQANRQRRSQLHAAMGRCSAWLTTWESDRKKAGLCRCYGGPRATTLSGACTTCGGRDDET